MTSTDYLMTQPNTSIWLEKYISSYKFINLDFSFKCRKSIGKLNFIWRRQRCKVDCSMVEIWPRGHFGCSFPISLNENDVECMQMTVTPSLFLKKFYQSPHILSEWSRGPCGSLGGRRNGCIQVCIS